MECALSLKAGGDDGSGLGIGMRGSQQGHKQEWYEIQEERKRGYYKFLRQFTGRKRRIAVRYGNF